MSAAIAHAFELLLWGGCLGAFGQFLRAVVGVVKPGGPLSSPTTGAREPFRASQFYFTLFVGFIAGSAAVVLSNDLTNQTALSVTAKLCLVAAGYAGTDFIEGITGRFAASSAKPPMASRGRANLLRD